MRKVFNRIGEILLQVNIEAGYEMYKKYIITACMFLTFLVALPLYAADSILLDEIVVKGTKLEVNQACALITPTRMQQH